MVYICIKSSFYLAIDLCKGCLEEQNACASTNTCNKIGESVLCSDDF